MQRSLSLLRQLHRRNILSLSHYNKNYLPLKPQYIAIRGNKTNNEGDSFNPGLDGDYMELSPTAWKEKRLYRYYKFSENVKATEQGRGYAAGIFMITAGVTLFFVLYLIDYQISFQYRPGRQYWREVIRPMAREADEKGYFLYWNYQKDGLKKAYEDVREIQKKHDAPNKREWHKQMSLHQCIKREKDFDSPYHHEFVQHELSPVIHPAATKFRRGEGVQGEGLGVGNQPKNETG